MPPRPPHDRRDLAPLLLPERPRLARSGSLEKLMHAIGMFDRPSAYRTEGFAGSGADFMPEYKAPIFDGQTIDTPPYKVCGPEQNDLALQLHKVGIDRVILAGMSANLCVQAHLHELLEQAFEVAAACDATAAAILPEGDGYLAALINFRFIANAPWTTDDAVARIAARVLRSDFNFSALSSAGHNSPALIPPPGLHGPRFHPIIAA